jgi:hypothetical protein
MPSSRGQEDADPEDDVGYLRVKEHEMEKDRQPRAGEKFDEDCHVLNLSVHCLFSLSLVHITKKAGCANIR